MKKHLLIALLACLSACAHRPPSGDIADLTEEDHWRCDDGKQFVATMHAGLNAAVLDVGNREYTLRPIDIDDNGRMRAARGAVVFEAFFEQTSPYRATASLRGVVGGPYVNCERLHP